MVIVIGGYVPATQFPVMLEGVIPMPLEGVGVAIGQAKFMSSTPPFEVNIIWSGSPWYAGTKSPSSMTTWEPP
jgi:hypothetical protein